MGSHDSMKEIFALASDRVVQAWAGGILAASVAIYLLYPGFFLGFLFGCLSLLAAQAAGLLYVWNLIKPKPKTPQLDKDKDVMGNASGGLDDGDLQASLEGNPTKFLEGSELVGLMWVSTRACQVEEDSGPQGHGKLRKNVKKFDAQPRCAKLEGLRLVLSGPGGVSEAIVLQGCEVKAISESETAKKKWARKFPIRISHPTLKLWHDSKKVFIYFPDGWQKELWCFVLRKSIRIGLSSRAEDPGWQRKLREEFFKYQTDVQDMYPDLLNLVTAAALESKAGAVETVDSKAASSRALWRRRGRSARGQLQKVSSSRGPDDWDSVSGSPAPSLSGSSWAGTAPGGLERSAVAPPLGVGNDAEALGFRNKLRSFVAAKKAQIQESFVSRSIGSDANGDHPMHDSIDGDVADVLSGQKQLKEEGEESRLSEDEKDVDLPQVAQVGPSQSSEMLSNDTFGTSSGKDEGESDWEDTVKGLPRGHSESALGGAFPAKAAGSDDGTPKPDVKQETAQRPPQEAPAPALEGAVSAINFLVARMFFDLEHQKIINTKLQEKLQEKLGLILTPSAIGTLSCSHFEFGSSPPLLKAIRPASTSAKLPEGFFAADVDFLFNGKASFTIETRLDLKDSPFLLGDGDSNVDGGSLLEDVAEGEGELSEETAAAFLDGSKASHLVPSPAVSETSSPVLMPEPMPGTTGVVSGARTLEPPAEIAVPSEVQKANSSEDNSLAAQADSSRVSLSSKSLASGMKLPSSSSSSSSGSSTTGTAKKPSRLPKSFKDFVVHVASGLSQVPLSITVTVTSVKGTLRIRVPPPPTDSLWLGCIEQPEMSLSFVPSIGEKQLKRFPLAAKIVDKVKELINRTLVLPSCVPVPIRIMKADDDDWLPREPRMLPWRPALVPAYAKGHSVTLPTSTESASSAGARKFGESEISWEGEEESKQEGVGERSRRLFRPDLSRRGESGSLLASGNTPAVLGRMMPQRQPSSPARRAQLNRDASSNRSILAAAKTSLQTATSFVKNPGVSASTGVQGEVQGSAAPFKKATSVFLKKREPNEQVPVPAVPASKSMHLPVTQTVHAEGADMPLQANHALESSRSLDGQKMGDGQGPRLISHSGDLPFGQRMELERIVEGGEGVRRSTSAQGLEEVESMKFWIGTPLIAHLDSSDHQSTTGLFDHLHTAGSSSGKERASEWHGREATKGEMKGSSPLPGNAETLQEPASRGHSEEWPTGDPLVDQEHDSKRPSTALVLKEPQRALVSAGPHAVSKKAHNPAEQGTNSHHNATDAESTLGIADTQELGTFSQTLAGGAEDEGRKATFSMRREMPENWKNKAKDLVGKLGDKEVHAQARLVVGEKAIQAKEKAKRFVSFLKEKHASLSSHEDRGIAD